MAAETAGCDALDLVPWRREHRTAPGLRSDRLDKATKPGFVSVRQIERADLPRNDDDIDANIRRIAGRKPGATQKVRNRGARMRSDMAVVGHHDDLDAGGLG